MNTGISSAPWTHEVILVPETRQLGLAQGHAVGTWGRDSNWVYPPKPRRSWAATGPPWTASSMPQKPEQPLRM